MAARTWSSAGSTDMNDGANYSGAGALLATDDLTFDNTSVINAAATANLSVNSITIASTFTGTWSLAGYTLTCAAGFSDDGTTGAHNYGNGITCNGASSTFHVGSGVGSITATSCALTMNGTTAMVLDMDKTITLKSLVLGVAAFVTNSGAAVTTYSSTSLPLTLNNNCTFTTNTAIVLTVSTSSNIWSIGTGCTINGTSGWSVRATANAITIGIPAITATSLTLNFQGVTYTNTIFTLLGAINIGTSVIELCQLTVGAGIAITANINGYSVTCGILRTGINAGQTGSTTVNFGASVISCTSFDGSTRNVAGQSQNDNLQTSTWSCSGNWTFGTNHTADRGTSTVTITNTSTVTSNSKCFYHFKVDSGANTVTLADNLCCEKYTLVSGALSKNGYTLSVGEWNAVVFLGKKKAARRRLLLTA